MIRALAGALMVFVAGAATACPLCLGAIKLTITTQDLVASEHAVLAVPEGGGARFRVIEVIRGNPPPGGTLARDDVSRLDPIAIGHRKPLLLLRDETWVSWISFGAIDTTHAEWLRKLTTRKPFPDMTPADWQAHVAYMLPYLENPEPLVAEIAYGDLASAPYGAIRTLKPRLDAAIVRRWADDPTIATRASLYILLLGIAGDERDATRLEQRLDAAWKANDATNVGPLLAADLELRGPSRMTWIDDRYIRDKKRSPTEIEAMLLALSVQGSADRNIPRARVIESYRLFMKAHKPMAGYVAPDFAQWGYWDAGPELAALLRSDKLYPASRVAIVSYLKQSPRPDAKAAVNSPSASR